MDGVCMYINTPKHVKLNQLGLYIWLSTKLSKYVYFSVGCYFEDVIKFIL